MAPNSCDTTNQHFFSSRENVLKSVTLPVRICSAEGRHCGWGTSLLGMGWGSGCKEGVLRLTEWEALYTGCLLKYILKDIRTIHFNNSSIHFVCFF